MSSSLERRTAAAARAQIDVVDRRRRDAGFLELRTIRGRDVEQHPVTRTRREEATIGRAKCLDDVRTDLVATRSDRRAERHAQIAGLRPRPRERIDRRGGHPGRRPAPARVGRGYTMSDRIHDQDR